QKWGIGTKGKDRGVLILLAVADHHYQVRTGYGVEGILPDGKVGSFGREAVPLLKQGDYNGALLLITSRIADVIAQDAGIELTGAQPEAPRPPPEDTGFPVSGVAILVIILLIVIFSPLRRLLFWWLLLGGGGGRGGWSSGSGGWGGGGFGGGGGGFGGFGGGS